MNGRLAVLLAAGISICMLAACGGNIKTDTIPEAVSREKEPLAEDAPYPEESLSVSKDDFSEEDRLQQEISSISKGNTSEEDLLQQEPLSIPKGNIRREDRLQQELSSVLGDDIREGNRLQQSGEPPGFAQGLPKEPPALYITISAAGDVTLGNYFEQGYWGSFRETYAKEKDPAYFFENVYEIFSEDDMTIVNLEGPLTYAQERREGQAYSMSGDPEYVDVLTAGSVEAVGMGNNHRLDYLEKGSSDTVAALEGAGISYAYDKYTGIYETQGIRIGFISVNEVGQGAGVEKYIKEGVERLREEGCQLVLASCHWGTEREYYPEDYQKSLGRKCIEWGVDLVIGHHPHVMQGIEEYQGRYIIYSLGNFCFGANRNPPDKDCLIVQQTFAFVDGELQEETVLKVIPCSVSSVTERNDYKPTPAEGAEAQRILDRLNEYSKGFGLQFDEDGHPVK